MNIFRLSSDQELSTCRKFLFATAAISILILALYSNTFNASWHFDDEQTILDNHRLHLTELSPQALVKTFYSAAGDTERIYRPVSCLSLALNYYFGKTNVFGYHLVNISVHLLASLFLFALILETLNLPLFKAKYGPKSYSIALLATFLWAINPLHTQAITYIVQRMASMAAMFYIMAMYFYLKARISKGVYPRSLWYSLCIISGILAFGSKENAAMLPFSLFLFDLFLIQGLTRENIKRNAIALAAVILLPSILALVLNGPSFFDPAKTFSGYGNRPFTLAQRLLTEPRIILFYISLLLYPMPNRLNIAHEIVTSTSFMQPISTLFSILILIATISCTLIFAKKRPLISLCILFFFINHLIESSIFPLELVFEHRNYLPSMLLFIPVAIGIVDALKFYLNKEFMKWIFSGFIILVLIGLGHSTFMRNFVWKSERTLWMDSADKSPRSSRPHHNLGRYYQDHGYDDMAIQEYQKALESTFVNRLDSVFVTYYNLGKIYAQRNDFRIAKSFYEKAENLNSGFPPFYNDMAALSDREGKPKEARKYLLKALKLAPHDGFATFNLGFHYLRQGKPEKALSYLTKLPASEESFGVRLPLYLGIAFKQTGRLGMASVFLEKAIRKNPTQINVHTHLAEVYYIAGKKEWAEREIASAIDLIGKRGSFESVLRDLTNDSRSRNLQPDKKIIIRLMRKVMTTKSKLLQKWARELPIE